MTNQPQSFRAAEGEPAAPEPKIVYRDAFLVAGLRYAGKNEHGEIPAQTYAVLPAHDVPDLGRAFDYLYGKWLPQSKEYKAADGPCLELYPATYSQDLIIYVYVPVQRKKTGC
jgi:DNA gyrase inhibitor GyrI